MPSYIGLNNYQYIKVSGTFEVCDAAATAFKHPDFQKSLTGRLYHLRKLRPEAAQLNCKDPEFERSESKKYFTLYLRSSLLWVGFHNIQRLVTVQLDSEHGTKFQRPPQFCNPLTCAFGVDLLLALYDHTRKNRLQNRAARRD